MWERVVTSKNSIVWKRVITSKTSIVCGKGGKGSTPLYVTCTSKLLYHAFVTVCKSSHMIKPKRLSQLIGQFGQVRASAVCKQPEKHGVYRVLQGDNHPHVMNGVQSFKSSHEPLICAPAPCSSNLTWYYTSTVHVEKGHHKSNLHCMHVEKGHHK
jgi:hypothetical protein